MRTIHRGNNWRIVINGREHGEPHFHVTFSDGTDCAVSISRLVILAGGVLPKRVADAISWAGKNQGRLLKVFEEMNP